jgi:L-asparaginase
MKKLLMIFLLPLLTWADPSPKETRVSQGLPKVALVVTGGTIVQVNDPKTGASVPAQSVEDILAAVPDLNKMADITVIPFSNLDSSQMTPELWAQLSQVVNLQLKQPDLRGVVVVHGTDTMAEGSYFLDLTITENKPVVFVGSMKNASDPHSDGPTNLIDAVTQVCSDEAYDWGVTVTLNNYINSARFVEKKQSTNIQAFNSGDKGILGYVVNQKVYRVNDRPFRQSFSIPPKLPKVDIIYDYAGSDGAFVRYATDHGADGIVVEGFGSGNVNAPMYDAIRYALRKGVAVVITTRVPEGGVFPFYGDPGGGQSLKDAGAIVAGDLPAPKARILLMLALPVVESNHSLLYKYFLNY